MREASQTATDEQLAHIGRSACPDQRVRTLATATPRLAGRDGAEQRAGSLEVDAQPSRRQYHLPEGAARKVSASVRRAYIRAPPRHRPRTGDFEGPWSRRRSSRGFRGLGICLPCSGGYATPAACPVQRLPGPMIRRTCRLVTGRSTDLGPHGQTRPGYRSSRSRTAINGHIVLGSNNFRSPTRSQPAAVPMDYAPRRASGSESVPYVTAGLAALV